MNREQALALVKKHGSMNKAAAAIKMPRTSLQYILNGGSSTVKSSVSAKAEPIPVKHAKKLNEFRELYDKSFYVPKKIKAALALLGSGWAYEAEFSKSAGVSLADLSAVREQFVDYIVQIGRDGRRAWAGTKSVADQMRRMV